MCWLFGWCRPEISGQMLATLCVVATRLECSGYGLVILNSAVVDRFFARRTILIGIMWTGGLQGWITNGRDGQGQTETERERQRTLRYNHHEGSDSQRSSELKE